MMLPLPAGAEVSIGFFDHLGVGAAYSKLPTDALMLQGASLHNQGFFGDSYSAYVQWHSRKGVANGLIAEAGTHFIVAKQFTCTETDGFGCLETGTERQDGVDFSMNAGYGGNWGWVRYYGLLGYRFQSIEVRSVPLDARIGLGFSWPRS